LITLFGFGERTFIDIPLPSERLAHAVTGANAAPTRAIAEADARMPMGRAHIRRKLVRFIMSTFCLGHLADDD
jgi:hypothetical protein